MLKRSVLILCCALTSVRVLSAATYYVNSSTGNDSSNGSSGAPWRTFVASVNRLSAGDTLMVSGTFQEAPSGVVLPVSGTAASPITIKGDSGGATIVMNGPDGYGNYRFTGNYIVLDGLKFTTYNPGVGHFLGLRFDGSYCTVKNSEVFNGQGNSGDTFDLFETKDSASFCTFTNLYIHDCDDCDLFRIWGTLNTITHCVISNCTNVRNPGGAGAGPHADLIQCFGGTSLSNAFEGNLVYNLTCSGSYLNCSPDNSTGCGGSVSDWVFRNNIFTGGGGQSIFIVSPNFHIYNNVFYHYQPAAYDLQKLVSGQAENARILNNVYIGGGGYNDLGTILQSTIDYNAIDSASYGNTISWVKRWFGTHVITNITDAGFVNPAAGDFHLRSDSILRGKGINLWDDPSASRTDRDGNLRPPTGAWDIGPYQYGASGPSTNPLIAITPSSLAFGTVTGTVTKTITVQNFGAGVLSGTATVAPPFSIVSGGTYSLGSNQSQVVIIAYTPGTLNDSGVVTFTGGGGATATVTGSRLAVQTGLSFPATGGNITGPFTASSGAVSQSIEGTVTTGGQAVYNFTVTNTGLYVVQALVNAPSTANNSFFINIDGQPQDPMMIWDVPVTAGFEWESASWRGNGTSDADQFAPKVFNLTAGVHQLVIIGREADTQLQTISISQLPPPPLNLRIVAGL